VAITLMLAICFSVGIATASNAITLIVDGTRLTDVPPQLIQGRTMVPLRAAAEALGAKVDWDAKEKAVTIKRQEIWPDKVDPHDPRILTAVEVVSRYLGVMMCSSGLEDYAPEVSWAGIATKKALDVDAWGTNLQPGQEKYLTQPFMLTGEHDLVRFNVLDVRPGSDAIEVAARLFVAEKPGCSAIFEDIVYKVVWETRLDSSGIARKVALISSERHLDTKGFTENVW